MATLALQPGLFGNISERDYHADNLCDVPTLSCSLAKVLIDESPLHAYCQHPRLGNSVHRDVSSEMEFGSAAHKLALGKGMELAVCSEDNWMKKDAKAFRDEARANGHIPILEHKLVEATAQRDALLRQMASFDLLASFDAGKPEVVIVYDDGGVRCRAMLDKLYINEETKSARIFDVKTTESANPKGIGRLVFNQHYDMQEYSYRRAIECVRPDLAGRIEFFFLFIETSFPYCLTPARLSGEERTLGTSKWTRAWQMWDACTKAKSWPAYAREIYTSEAPTWGLNAEMGAKPILPL